jgi:hypothetical protein
MTCETVSLPNGATAIVCGTRGRRPIKCSVCGRPGDLLCDWKRKGDPHQSTCDAPLCRECTTKPARGKDLCPKHAEAFERWKASRV